MMFRLLARFAKAKHGTIAVTAGVVAPVLMAVAGIGVDYAKMTSIKVSLQGIADSAAVAGAREMVLPNSYDSQISSVARAFVNYKAKRSQRNFTTTVEIKQGKSISVNVSEQWSPFFAHLFSSNISAIAASATARLVSGNKICVLGLSKTDSATVSLTGASKITADGCGVYSNSASSSGMVSYKDSVLTAELTCSAGGMGGNTSNYNPAPLTDCPQINDPLIGRAPPIPGVCNYTNLSVSSEVKTLSPGVYCGGLVISGTSRVTLNPGVYVIKDGAFEVTQTSSISGEHVGFYLLGDKSTFLFAGASSISLTAPKQGPMAGLLFFEDRNAPLNRFHEIVTENARTLVGTIYLPRGNFAVSSKKKVADLSAYTAIVANKIQLNKYPTLELHSDYHLTDVPVPAALKGIGGDIVLSK